MTQKTLYRSVTNRQLAGVCGGLGEYFNIDPTLIRLLVAVLAIAGVGTGILFYIIAWIVIPEAPTINQP
jgi:phage shock protein C